MRLFHFSEHPGIAQFVPRPVRVPSPRLAGQEWLNGALVWAIDEPHQPMYLFPRQCPRILLWRTAATTDGDWETCGNSSARMVAYIETAWRDRVEAAQLYRYEFSDRTFEDLGDAGMWVSREVVTPKGVAFMDSLPALLRNEGVELRPLNDLRALKGVWASSVHASGIRLRNAMDW